MNAPKEVGTTTVSLSDHVQHETLAAALAAFQSLLPSIAKGNEAVVNSTKGSYKYSYADLKDVTEAALPLLGRHGLAWSAQPTLVGEHFVLRYALIHESTEQTIEGLYPLPDPSSTLPQALGSAITYARRYTLCSVIGIAPGGDDDDAAAANDAPASRARAARQSAPAPAAVAAPAAPLPVASRDWGAEILPVRDVDALRSVYEAAEEAKELATTIGGDHKESVLNVIREWGLPTPNGPVYVHQLISAVKGKIEAGEIPGKAETPAGEEPQTDAWAVADIPKDGES